MNYSAAVDQLSTTAREEIPHLVEIAQDLRTSLSDRDEALAELTRRFMALPHNGVAAIAADTLLRLAEGSRR